MSDYVSEAIKGLNEKMSGQEFDGTAKFDITGEGTFMLDSTGAHPGDDDADVTLSADADTFRAIFDGELNPTNAFMSGKLAIDGDMGQAMKLASVLG
ncbi:SCP2 sterol-binding domain-containing protein [Puniceibacterium sediminis]|uniref:SCP-2 sterol transfer family protein n=1 Tax=Puniceibacterium sediminis TaxID=1608407 RepID=A0A238XD27_9RHOB|nr:SCP2 sterol-binding domain-containing protein [Puniceibacterium sediminis]SNR55809.1 SCP-2 sterol transfer family protein [Puniceibacterium sediminis]